MARRATMSCPVEMPPAMPPLLIGEKTGGPSLPLRMRSAFSSPANVAGCKSRTDLDALDRIDAHQRAGEFGIELAVDRRAPSGGNPARMHFDNRANRAAGFACFVEHILPVAGGLGIRTPEWILSASAPSSSARDRWNACRSGSPRPEYEYRCPALIARRRRLRPERRFRAHWRGRRRDNRARHISGHRNNRHDPAGRCRGFRYSLLTADRCFRSSSEIGVPVVTGPPVRSSSKVPDRIFTASSSRRCVTKRRRARAAFIQIALNEGRIERQARWAAIHDTAQRRPMTFAPGRHAKEMAERIV